VKAALVCAALALAVPARAQSWEVLALLGYTNTARLDTTAENVDELSIAGAFTFGAAATFFVTEHLGVEGLFMTQPTAVRMTSAGIDATALDLKVSQVLGSLVYQPLSRSAALQPFVFGGAGASVFTANAYDAESKFAWTVGGGLKWMPSPLFGTLIQLRYKSTRLNDSGSTLCDPFGFCQDGLPQLEFASGLVLRF
jgi:Outer membrane protein beta-barrel domain